MTMFHYYYSVFCAKNFQRLIGFLVVVSVTACGGGSSSGSASKASSNAASSSNSSSTQQTQSSSSSSHPLSQSLALRATVITDKSVHLQWRDISLNAENAIFRIIRDGNIVGEVQTPEFYDPSLNPDQQYSYQVQINEHAQWATTSPSLTVRTSPQANSSSSKPSDSTVDIQAPSAPRQLQAINIKSNRVDLRWIPAVDNLKVALYEVHRHGLLVAMVSGEAMTYLDQELTPNTAYSYYVVALDAAGNRSVDSNNINLYTQTMGQLGINLLWQPPLQRENGYPLSLTEIAGYELRYRKNSLDEFTSISIGPSVNHLQRSDLHSDYDYQIAVIDRNNLYSSFITIHSR